MVLSPQRTVPTAMPSKNEKHAIAICNTLGYAVMAPAFTRWGALCVWLDDHQEKRNLFELSTLGLFMSTCQGKTAIVSLDACVKWREMRRSGIRRQFRLGWSWCPHVHSPASNFTPAWQPSFLTGRRRRPLDGWADNTRYLPDTGGVGAVDFFSQPASLANRARNCMRIRLEQPGLAWPDDITKAYTELAADHRHFLETHA